MHSTFICIFAHFFQIIQNALFAHFYKFYLKHLGGGRIFDHFCEFSNFSHFFAKPFVPPPRNIQPPKPQPPRIRAKFIASVLYLIEIDRLVSQET